MPCQKTNAVQQDFSRNQLLALNAAGLIPGPDETSADFSARCLKCLEAVPSFSAAHFEKSLSSVQERYGLRPSWTPITYTNQGLFPWHGACTWIGLDATSFPATVQLRKAFASREKLLGLYGVNDLLAHEFVHVGRMAFNEPIYEEFLAYQLLTTSWRRTLSLLFLAPSEFLCSTFLSLIVIALLVFLPDFMNSLLLFLPALCFTCGIIKISARLNAYKRCLSTLGRLIPGKEKWLLYRLTDREIQLFSKLPADAIISYAKEQKELSMRWKVLFFAYLDEGGTT